MVIILINLININTFPSELTLIVTMPLLPEEITFEFARFSTLGNDGLPIGGRALARVPVFDTKKASGNLCGFYPVCTLSLLIAFVFAPHRS